MTSRERVQAAVRFEPPDRLPCNESPWEQTLAAWREQGIPAATSLADYSVPPDVTLERYQWLLDTARAIFHEPPKG